MTELSSLLNAAVQRGDLLPAAKQNVTALLASTQNLIDSAAIQELVETEAWTELNDRFFKTLSFGTGGLRGRTIGNIVTTAERGNPNELGRPEHACVGTNAMNPTNVQRATVGLVRYVADWLKEQGEAGTPKIVIAHDTRHFSRDFAELTAQVAVEEGCEAFLFDGPRSTPQLSFAVRHLHAHAGVVITASHNPSHDNGYKVYFNDGAQVVEPHASGIIARVNGITNADLSPSTSRSATQAKMISLGPEIDKAYSEQLKTLILDPEVITSQRDRLKIILTPIHGTGGVIIKPLLDQLGFNWSIVEEQDRFDGRFPTVASPNPENAEALDLAIQKAQDTNADLVMGTDPDADRLGVAVRNRSGSFTLLTGNQLAALICWYRVITFFKKGILTAENAHRGVVIKTIVTSDLLKAIATRHGLHCVETLTGFKYIGAKLGAYEAALPEAFRTSYRSLSDEVSRNARLKHSYFYVFGGEESYGYSGADFVRDKDANGSALMFAEAAAYAASQDLTLDELLDRIYAEYGCFMEKGASLTFEGAEGLAKIHALIESYTHSPPKTVLEAPVAHMVNFASETVVDADGESLPSERMLLITLEDGWRVAIRPSGTEPKIKFYLFAANLPKPGQRFTLEEIATIKAETNGRLLALWDWLKNDAHTRAA